MKLYTSTHYRPNVRDNEGQTIYNANEFEVELFKKIFNHNSKSVFHLYANKLDYFIKKSQGKILPRLFKSSTSATAKFLIFPRNHLFYQSFNEKISQLLSNGIVNHFAKDMSESINPKRFSHLGLETVKPMSMEHLKAGFLVWIFSLIFPITAFIVEWIIVLKKNFAAAALKKKEEREKKRRNRKLQQTLIKMKIESEKSLKSQKTEAKVETKHVKLITDQKNETCLADSKECDKKSISDCKPILNQNKVDLNVEVELTIETLYDEIMEHDNHKV